MLAEIFVQKRIFFPRRIHLLFQSEYASINIHFMQVKTSILSSILVVFGHLVDFFVKKKAQLFGFGHFKNVQNGFMCSQINCKSRPFLYSFPQIQGIYNNMSIFPPYNRFLGPLPPPILAVFYVTILQNEKTAKKTEEILL